MQGTWAAWPARCTRRWLCIATSCPSSAAQPRRATALCSGVHFLAYVGTQLDMHESYAVHTMLLGMCSEMHAPALRFQGRRFGDAQCKHLLLPAQPVRERNEALLTRTYSAMRRWWRCYTTRSPTSLEARWACALCCSSSPARACSASRASGRQSSDNAAGHAEGATCQWFCCTGHWLHCSSAILGFV